MPQASPGTPLANPEKPTGPPAKMPFGGPPVETFSETLKLEYQLVKVPYEEMKRTIRNTSKLVEKDVATVMAGITEAAGKNLSREEAEQQIENWMKRLQGLKRKLEESNKSGQDQSLRCRSRYDCMSALTTGSEEELQRWNKSRVDRYLCDYMFRNGYYQSAAIAAEQAGVTDLVDTGVFQEMQHILSGLQRQDCGPALAWCNENKSRLKKNKSSLEFRLRVQQFVELVRSEDLIGAVDHARRHLAAWGSTGHLEELQRAMVVLVVKANTDTQRYKEILDPKQWEQLETNFVSEFLKLYGMTLQAPLAIHLQAGLSALKTPFAYEPNCTKEDPLSQTAFRTLADPLPFSKHIRSQLVCWMSKEAMDDHNPPMVLPTGLVYSKRALEEMAAKHNGKIRCPRTGLEFNLNQVQKAFVF